MTTRPNVESLQDMPPKGGFPEFEIPKRRFSRPRGPSGAVVWGLVIGATALGYYRIGVTNDEKRNLRKETREARMAILPHLKAEHDLRLLAQLKSDRELEEKYMKNVEGWIMHEKIYSKRWITPWGYEDI